MYIYKILGTDENIGDYTIYIHLVKNRYNTNNFRSRRVYKTLLCPILDMIPYYLKYFTFAAFQEVRHDCEK
jgi:hypothetical protein